MKPRLTSPARRWSIAARAAAAIIGGYGFIWLFTAAMTLALRAAGLAAADAVLAVTMSSFLIWAVIAMAVFHMQTARRAWAGLLLGGAGCIGVLFLLTGRLLP